MSFLSYRFIDGSCIFFNSVAIMLPNMLSSSGDGGGTETAEVRALKTVPLQPNC